MTEGKKEDAEAIHWYRKHSFGDSGYIDEGVPNSLNLIRRLS